MSAGDVPGNTELGPWDSVYGPLLPTPAAPAVTAADEQVERVVREALASEAFVFVEGEGTYLDEMELNQATGLVVDALAAMGETRTVTTVEELHALPEGTAIRCANGYVTAVTEGFVAGSWAVPATVLTPALDPTP